MTSTLLEGSVAAALENRSTMREKIWRGGGGGSAGGDGAPEWLGLRERGLSPYSVCTPLA